jgi:hypothetical protein
MKRVATTDWTIGSSILRGPIMLPDSEVGAINDGFEARSSPPTLLQLRSVYGAFQIEVGTAKKRVG